MRTVKTMVVRGTAASMRPVHATRPCGMHAGRRRSWRRQQGGHRSRLAPCQPAWVRAHPLRHCSIPGLCHLRASRGNGKAANLCRDIRAGRRLPEPPWCEPRPDRHPRLPRRSRPRLRRPDLPLGALQRSLNRPPRRPTTLEYRQIDLRRERRDFDVAARLRRRARSEAEIAFESRWSVSWRIGSSCDSASSSAPPSAERARLLDRRLLLESGLLLPGGRLLLGHAAESIIQTQRELPTWVIDSCQSNEWVGASGLPPSTADLRRSREDRGFRAG